MLKAGHAKVKQLFDSYKTRTRRADRARLVQKHVRLSPFMLFWMEIFHPVCRELIDDDSLDEAQVEHDSAKVLISELLAGSPEDPFYDAKFEVLADQIRHHIQEEEGDSDSIFAKARSAGADLVTLRQQLKERRTAFRRTARGTLQLRHASFRRSAEPNRRTSK